MEWCSKIVEQWNSGMVEFTYNPVPVQYYACMCARIAPSMYLCVSSVSNGSIIYEYNSKTVNCVHHGTGQKLACATFNICLKVGDLSKSKLLLITMAHVTHKKLKLRTVAWKKISEDALQLGLEFIPGGNSAYLVSCKLSVNALKVSICVQLYKLQCQVILNSTCT